VQSIYHADLEYVLDIAVAANCADYIVTHPLTPSLISLTTIFISVLWTGS